MKASVITLILGLPALFPVNVLAAILYVDLNSLNPTPPYTNWITAATNIQHAVDVAASGDTVLVTNGTYATGGRRWYDSGTNRVTLTNAVTLRSVNGPAVTIIVGAQVTGNGTVLTNAVRCVGIGNGALLSGFTLTNGQAGWGNYPDGGGVANLVGSSAVATVSNCVLVGNLSTNGGGGGASRVKLINCQIARNYADYGGGAAACTLVNCTVVSNAASSGGGVYGSTYGGVSLLSNCTIVGNLASGLGGGVSGQGSGWMRNCVVYYNVATSGSNYTGIEFDNCCTTPLPTNGVGNITNLPQFVDLAASDLRLQSNSPCINAGRNSDVVAGVDLDGNPRIVGGTVDMGAYEFQTPSSVLSYAWAQQYGLPTDGSVDFADPDSDGANNWQESRADTVPTNALSLLRMITVTNGAPGLKVVWLSVPTRSYWLERASHLTSQPAFQTISSNLLGVSGAKTFADTNVAGGGPFFYRVGVH